MGILAYKLVNRQRIAPTDVTVAIQGLGNVGTHAAKFLHEAGFRIVAVSDRSGTYYHPEGLDIPQVLRKKLHDGTLKGWREAEHLPGEALVELDVDMLIPSALAHVITGDNVDRVRARWIIEAANGPVDPEADRILHQRGVLVLPDILANAGGVTVSYFEWVQNLQQYRWGLNRVRQELDRVLHDAFEQVWHAAQQRQLSLRTAAFVLSVERVYRAARLAGLAS